MDSDPRALWQQFGAPRLPCPTSPRARAHQGTSDVARATPPEFSSVVGGRASGHGD